MKNLLIFAIILSVGYFFWNDQKFEWPTDQKINQGISQIKGSLDNAQKIISDPDTEEEIKNGIALLKEKIGGVEFPKDIAGNLDNLKNNISNIGDKIKNLDLGENLKNNENNYNSENIKVRSTQDAFLAVRGNPGIFMILFSDVKLDKTGKPIKREKTLRVDNWSFGVPENKISEFENGFFMGEKNISEKLNLMSHAISPLFFKETTTQKNIINKFGNPSCKTQTQAGKNILRTLKYEETSKNPYITVLFSDEKIMAVTVGIAFSENENQKLCP